MNTGIGTETETAKALQKVGRGLHNMSPSAKRPPDKPIEDCEVCGEPFDYKEREGMEQLTSLFNSPNFWWERNYDDIHKPCKEKLDAEQKARDEAEEQRLFDEKIKHLFRSASIDYETAKTKTFSSFQTSRGTQEAYQAMNFWNPDEHEFGIMLMGPVGCGKTHLMTALAIKWIEKKRQVLIKNVPVLFDELRAGYDDGSFQKKMDIVKSVEILILDDIGAEKPNEWTEEKLTLILDYRISHSMPTFVSTNLKGQELRKRVNERFLSRLAGLCVSFQMDGIDRRTEIMKKRQMSFKAKVKRAVAGENR